MGETHSVLDPFLGKAVEVSNRLVDRLRGRYASGPTMPNGEPEFGWREFPAPPIQHEAAEEIERLTVALTERQARILKLEKRIHNQRANCRLTWEIIEMRAQYKRCWYPSELLTHILKRSRRSTLSETKEG